MAAATLSLHAPVATLHEQLADLLRKSALAAQETGVPADERVHELRKRLKRARAWALMLPEGVARPVQAELRDIHRRLAARRDLDATLEAVHRLNAAARHAGRDRAREALDAVAAAVRERLQSGEQPLPGTEDAVVRLLRLANALESQAVEGDFAEVARAVARLARNSRRAMRRAFKSGDPADYHRWRKWMKYHGFHLRYLVPLWPALLRVEAEAAEHCATWLGDSQDLQLVRAALARVGEGVGKDAGISAAQRNALSNLIDREQGRLLNQAASVGLHLHALSPAALEKRLRRYEQARLHRRTGLT